MEDDAIDQRETMEDYSRSTTENGEKVAPPSSGGLINQLISTIIIIPTEKGATESDELKEQKKAVEEEEQGKGEGGILENLISNLTSPRASNPEDVDFFQDPEDQQTQNLQDPGDDGGGGLMETIVSHLPISSIAENEGPTSDEASLLIHSVVHD